MDAYTIAGMIFAAVTVAWLGWEMCVAPADEG